MDSPVGGPPKCGETQTEPIVGNQVEPKVAAEDRAVPTEPLSVDPPKKQRDPWLDNARIFAAVMIVVMHFAQDLRSNSAVINSLYYALWPMRVPLYVLIAGYFSSAAPLSGRRAISLLRNVLFVYLAFRLIAAVQRGLLHGTWNFDLATPSLALWFLLALFCWRVTLPLLNHIRYLPVLAVVVAIIAGFIPSVGPEFGASRAFGFWPIFILGWQLRQFGLRRLLDYPAVRAGAVLVVLGSVYAGFMFEPVLKNRHSSMKRGYRGEVLSQVSEAGFRIMLLAFAVVGALALLALIPKGRVPLFSYLGTGSLYIYLLHPVVLKQLEPYGFIPWVDSRPKLALFVVATALLGLLLGSKPVRSATRWLVQPRYNRPFKSSTL